MLTGTGVSWYLFIKIGKLVSMRAEIPQRNTLPPSSESIAA